MSKINELAHRYVALKNEIDELKQRKSDLQKDFDKLRMTELPEAMADEGIESVRIAGIGRVSLRSDVYVSIPADVKYDAWDWLRDHGHENLISETVNPSTLRAFCKEQLQNGELLPDDLFRITPYTQAVIQAKTMATKKTIAKKETTTDAVPSFVTGNRGNENVTMDDVTIPRIDVLQDLSPQIKKNKPEYIDGAEPGKLFNSVTGELYGTSLKFVPVAFRKEFLVWKDRDQGGGLFGVYQTEQDAREFIASANEPGLEVVDTAQHFVLIVHSDSTSSSLNVEEAVISMSKSKLKTSRQLNSIIRMAGGDRFASIYELSSIEAASRKGDYYGLRVKRLGWVWESLYRAAEDMYSSIMAGDRSVNYENSQAESEF